MGGVAHPPVGRRCGRGGRRAVGGGLPAITCIITAVLAVAGQGVMLVIMCRPKEAVVDVICGRACSGGTDVSRRGTSSSYERVWKECGLDLEVQVLPHCFESGDDWTEVPGCETQTVVVVERAALATSENSVRRLGDVSGRVSRSDEAM